MKRIMIGGLLICLMFALTGCGGNDVKTLVCTQSASGIDIELTTEFMGKKVNSMKMNYTMDISSYNETPIEAIKSKDFCTLVKGSMTGYENAFNNCKQNVANGKLLINADFDIDKITDSSIKEEGTYEEAKEGFEKTGYTCIIK